jgi:hypothetical protein
VTAVGYGVIERPSRTPPGNLRVPDVGHEKRNEVPTSSEWTPISGGVC